MDTLLFLQLFTVFIDFGYSATWSEWWTYEAISGPDFWGLVNTEWYICTKGKRQSPVNIDPQKLLYDSNLKPLRMDKHRMSGTLQNTGHDIRLVLDEPTLHYVNVSAGPLSYQYRVSEIILHFGVTDSTGSEHTINGVNFPAEIQILGYNSDLYGNMSQAIHSSNGLVMLALLAQVTEVTEVGKTSNPEFDAIAQMLKSVRYKGQQVRVRHISVQGLLPTTDHLVPPLSPPTPRATHPSPRPLPSSGHMMTDHRLLRDVRGIINTTGLSGNCHVDRYQQTTLHHC